MGKQIALLYFSTDYIKEYCGGNPIRWLNPKIANGAGNKLTPTPAMGVFFNLLKEKGNLFTQNEYVDYAWNLPNWYRWKERLTNEEIKGIEARLYRNFYPSAIDSIHVWSLLVESPEVKFNRGIIDIAADVTKKTDITIWTRTNRTIPIGLHGKLTEENKKWIEKKKKRGEIPKNIIDIFLPESRPMTPGNKRWYQISDMEKIIDRTKNLTINEPPIPTPWISAESCEKCKHFMPWHNYPLGGGTKTFCAYWIKEKGESKKIEINKITECPRPDGPLLF